MYPSSTPRETRWCIPTFFGGTNIDTVAGLALDSSGNAYLTGSTSSADFPVMNALQPALPGASVFKSTDGGVTWNTSGNGLNNLDVTHLAINPNTPSTLFASTQGIRDPESLKILIPSEVFTSTNSGSTWSSTGFASATGGKNIQQLTAPATGTVDLYATALGPGIFKFKGAAWSSASHIQIPPTNLNSSVFTQVAVDPAVQDQFFFTTDGDGLFEQTGLNGNSNVVGTAQNFSETDAVAIDPNNHSVVYVGNSNSGLFWRASTAAFHSRRPV